MDESILLVVYSRLPLDVEIENGVDPQERRLDSDIFEDGEAYEDFIYSDEARELDVIAEAVHNINSKGHIIGEPLS